MFKVARVRTKELIHTRIIGELLNPEGSHLKKYEFLQLFIEHLISLLYDQENLEVDENYDYNNKIQWIRELTLTNVSIKVEKNLGTKDKDKITGGFVDIWCELDGRILAIENKVFAKDQKNQLLRYYNSAKQSAPNSEPLIIYLTVDGKSPSSFSTGKNPHFSWLSLSYKELIEPWLQKCLEKSALNPILRESLRQYILLIQSFNKKERTPQRLELYNLILSQFSTTKELIKQLRVFKSEEDKERPSNSYLRNFREEAEIVELEKNNALFFLGQEIKVAISDQIESEFPDRFNFKWSYDPNKGGFHFTYKNKYLPGSGGKIYLKYVIESLFSTSNRIIRCINRTGKEKNTSPAFKQVKKSRLEVRENIVVKRLADVELIQNLVDASFREIFVKELVQNIIAFIFKCEAELK